MTRTHLRTSALAGLALTVGVTAGCSSSHKSSNSASTTAAAPSPGTTSTASTAASASASGHPSPAHKPSVAAAKVQLPPELLEPMSATRAAKWSPRIKRLAGVFAVFYDSKAGVLHVYLRASVSAAQKQRIITMIGKAATS